MIRGLVKIIYLFLSHFTILLFQVWVNLLAHYVLSLAFWCSHYRSRLLLETLKHFIKICRRKIKRKRAKRSSRNPRLLKKKREWLSALMPMMVKKTTHTRVDRQRALRAQCLFHPRRIWSTERRHGTTTTLLNTESPNLLGLQIRIVNLRAVMSHVIYIVLFHFNPPFAQHIFHPQAWWQKALLVI